MWEEEEDRKVMEEITPSEKREYDAMFSFLPVCGSFTLKGCDPASFLDFPSKWLIFLDVSNEGIAESEMEEWLP